MAKKKVTPIKGELKPTFKERVGSVARKTGKATVATGKAFKISCEYIPLIFDWLLQKITAPFLISLMGFLSSILKQSGKVLSVLVIVFTAYLIGYTFFQTVDSLGDAKDRYITAFGTIDGALGVLQGTVVGVIGIGLIFSKSEGGIMGKIKGWAKKIINPEEENKPKKRQVKKNGNRDKNQV